jgi:hypothetical protein
VNEEQGDQMSLRKKIAQNVAHPNFVNLWHNVYRPKNFGYYHLLKKIPKVNTRPIVKKSPNMVTLMKKHLNSA